ncbi:MAG: GNAT family N-acetyltransferase [Brumimicrobium sp.]
MRAEFENIELIHNKAEQKFELPYNGEVAFIHYEIKDGIYDLDETLAPEILRGTGVAGALTEKVFQTLKAEGKKIFPTCPYLHKVIQRKPEWKEIVDKSYEKFGDL